MENTNKKVGYVALIGRPNSGKSTFINALIEEKVSIVSPKPQTTQKCIKGIYNDDDSQIIFFDTPGVNEGKEEFFEHLNQRVIDSLDNSDVIVRFIDSSRRFGQEEEMISSILSKIDKPVIVAYSKIDLNSNPEKVENHEHDEETILKISSLEKKGFLSLLSEIKNKLKVGPLYYPDDYYTDQDYATRIGETIREKIFLNFYEEVPYGIFVEIGEMEEIGKLLKIQAYIYTESDSQKRIIIGKEGQSLTQIGTDARLDLEKIYGKKIFLALRVKVLPKWKKNKKILNKLY